MVQWGRFRSGLLVQEWGGGVTGTNTNETLMDFFSKYRPSIIALCEKHKVKWLFAFGSVLTSRFTEKSDIDLVVDFDKAKIEDYFSNYFDLKYALEKLLNRDINLLEEQAIRNPVLRRNIDRTKSLIYG